MNLLLTGATGLLGSSIVKLWRETGNLFGLYLGNYGIPDKRGISYYISDIRDKDNLEQIFSGNKIEVAIHAAGEARVDFCEKNYEIAYSTNVTGTKNMIGLCKKYNAKLVYISTNAVFDGTKPPYKEEDQPRPINVYGRVKLECENLVRKAFRDFLLIRPILMYGWNDSHERQNTVTWLLEKFRNGEKVRLVDDIFDNPLYALQCAYYTLKLIKNGKSGIYHIAGKDIMNRYQLGLMVAEIFGYDKDLIIPVNNSYFKDIAPRPKNTSYSTTKIERELGMEPLGAREGLLEMLKERDLVEQKSAV